MSEKLRVEYVSTDSLTPSHDNPRLHSRAVRRLLTKMIKAQGIINPIIVDQNNVIVAGHARHEAAHKLKLAVVPIIRVTHLSPEELRAYRLADNKLVESGEWDTDLVRIELEYLIEHEIDLDFTGFSAPEADLILQPMPVSELKDPSDIYPDELEHVVAAPGDVYHLGDHRILCGDIRNQNIVQQFMGDTKADAVFADPPYNVPIDGHVSGLGSHTHEEFAMASGEMSSLEFAEFLHTCFANMVRVSRDGSVHFICMDWRHVAELHAATSDIYEAQINLCVWHKTNAGMGSLYRSQHELIGVYRVGKTPHINNVELGKHGRYRTNIWTYPGMNSFGSDRDENLAAHPTVKPIPLIADALLDVTRRGDSVLDGFLGSGSTLLAAEQIGRICYGIEIDPRYIDVTIRRWYGLTGENTMHEQSGLTFSELAAQRAGEPDLVED